MTERWTHDTTVSVTVGPEGGYDCYDVDVRMHVTGTPAVPARIRFDEHDHPAEGAEIEFDRFEICEPKDGGGWTYRKPVPACYPDSNDQAVIDAVEAWWDDNADECWESLDGEGC